MVDSLEIEGEVESSAYAGILELQSPCIEGKALRDERLRAREEEDVEVVVDEGKMPIVERVGEGEGSETKSEPETKTEA